MPTDPPAKKRAPSPSDERFPNLAAQKDLDRAEHIERAMAAGLSRQQAEQHAEQELAGRDD